MYSYHMAQMNKMADAYWALFELPWKNSGDPGAVTICLETKHYHSLTSVGMMLPEAREAAQNQSLWIMLIKHTIETDFHWIQVLFKVSL